jgi:hypothetical protein
MTYGAKRLLVIAFAFCGAGVGVLSVSDQGAGLAVLFGAIGGVVGTAIGTAIFGVRGSRTVQPRPSVPNWNWTDALAENFWRDRGHPPLMKPSDSTTDKHMLDPDRLD